MCKIKDTIEEKNKFINEELDFTYNQQLKEEEWETYLKRLEEAEQRDIDMEELAKDNYYDR